MTISHHNHLWLRVVVVTMLTVITACNSRPDGVLSEGKMADVLADLTLVESLSDDQRIGNARPDSVAKVYRQSIMQSHGVTEAEFDSTLNWYGHNMEEYTKLYLAVDKRLEAREKRLAKNTQHTADAPENSLLQLPRMLSIGANDADRGFSFTIDGKKLKKGDCLALNMRFNNLAGTATIYMAAEYPKMETFFVRQQVHTSGPMAVTLQTDSARLPQRIVGYVHLTDAPLQRVWIDSLMLTATPLLPASYNRINATHRISPLK